MQTKNKLAELSLPELEKKHKLLKSAVIGLGLVSIIALGLLLYFAIKSEKYVLLVISGGLVISLLPSVVGLKAIEKEIKLRNS